MPPTISWADLAGLRVGVWGLGVEGRANLARLAEMGVDPVLVDDRGPDAGVAGRPVLATSEGGLEALAACEVVVKAPGISRYGAECQRLRAAGVVVAGGLGLWLAGVDRSRVLTVTGTKGKSTTVAIAGHLLEGWGYRALVGGNIGVPPWAPEAPTDVDWWVIEVSSYQATDLAVAPPVVAVTSLHADHLTWHGDEETYYRDKLSLCRRPGARVTVAAGDDARLRARARQLAPVVRWIDREPARGEPVDWVDGLALPGPHNRINARIARAALAEMGVPQAVDPAALAGAASGFAGLASRLTTVGQVGGVTFVDDGLSTNVLPTLAALDSFPGRRVALIAGGHDRGIDYAPLAAGLRARAEPTMVVTVYESGRRIAAALDERTAPRGPDGPHGTGLVWEAAADLHEAVARAHAWAHPDGVVLLSPAAPSFGAFADYRDRSAAFAAAMRRVAAGDAGGRRGDAGPGPVLEGGGESS